VDCTAASVFQRQPSLWTHSAVFLPDLGPNTQAICSSETSDDFRNMRPSYQENLTLQKHHVRFVRKYQNYQIKEDEISRACSRNGKKRNAYGILMVKPEARRPQRKRKRRSVQY
jgi:hypothetical protein